MNATHVSLALVLGAALAAAPAEAQSKKKKPAATKTAVAPKTTPANARMTALQDRRSDGHFPRCTLGIELPDYPAHEVTAARVVVKKAVDDLGTDLLKEDAADVRLEPTQRGQFGKPDDGKAAPPTIVFAEMKNPPRAAKVLKEVSGEIELFVPSRDPNGEARIERFLSLAGKPAAHPALRANGVEISFVSKAQLDAERKKAEEAETAKLKKEGYEDADSIRSMVESALYSFPKGEEREVVLKVKDPKKAIQEIKAFNGSGERVFGTDSEESGFRVLTFWNDSPQADWTLSIQMRSDSSLVRHTFAFRDVPLP
ncbi:MAG: hypothetical protein ACYC4P_03185 [Thermoanaerobaculia bacterium]